MRLIDADELVKYLKKYHGMSQGVISDVEHFPTAHVAIEALEKQIPKKPYGTNGNWMNLSMNRCPYCKTYPLNPKDDYCPNCGQALDWEKEE